MGGVVHFPRSGSRKESELHDAAEDAVRSTHATPDTARITWMDVRLSRDGDDDDGGGGRAA
jgi:hypothetical protein